MIKKSHIYKIVFDITPPIIIRWLKKTSFYNWVGKKLNRYNGNDIQCITISSGHMSGVKLILDPNGPWQKDMLNGAYDKELFETAEKLIKPGDVIYDIGAHIGYHSLAFAKLINGQGTVHSFEPNPANVVRAKEILLKNPKLAELVTNHNLALSDVVGETSFLSSDDIESGTSTGGFINSATTLWERERYTDGIGFKSSIVPLETIDHLVSTRQILPPNFMKIDVEGAEQSVLKGSAETLKKYRPFIIIEFHSIYSAFSCMNELSKVYTTFIELKIEPDGRVMILVKP